jgi:hypothetical protein
LKGVECGPYFRDWRDSQELESSANAKPAHHSHIIRVGFQKIPRIKMDDVPNSFISGVFSKIQKPELIFFPDK